MDIAKKRCYLVVGLGITGLSVVRFLKSQAHTVIVTDSRNNPPEIATIQQTYPEVPLLLGNIQIPPQTTHIILSPGVVWQKTTDLPIWGDIELFAQSIAKNKPIIAITGSNGKTTVSTLLKKMADIDGKNFALGGNIGIPALSLLEKQPSGYILELSSFQLERTFSLHPKAATILNISPDHLDRYKNMHDYSQAKQKIYSKAECIVTNRRDNATYPQQDGEHNILSFGLDQPKYNQFGLLQYKGKNWLANNSELLITTEELALTGQHNIENSLAALALGETVGFSRIAMLEALKKFQGLPYRCETIGNFNNIIWVNDSKGTNVGATLTAIQKISAEITGKCIIILGGDSKGADLSPLVSSVQDNCRLAILIGNAKQTLYDLLYKHVPCYKSNSLREVVKIAADESLSGDGVLFSPACASFDMFEDYMARGKKFNQEVLEYFNEQKSTIII